MSSQIILTAEEIDLVQAYRRGKALPPAEPQQTRTEVSDKLTPPKLDDNTIDRAHLDDATDDAEQMALYIIGRLAVEGVWTRTILNNQSIVGLQMLYDLLLNALREALTLVHAANDTVKLQF